jgi:hypothetical protein
LIIVASLESLREIGDATCVFQRGLEDECQQERNLLYKDAVDVIWVSNAKSSRAVLSCQLTPGVRRAQFVQAEHSHHRGFLILEVSHCGESNRALPSEDLQG